MKNWILSKLAGPVGVVVRPVIAALVGVLVGLAYEQAGALLHKAAWLGWLTDRTIASLDPSTLAMLTPGSIGAAVSVAVWALLSDWALAKLRGGNREVQTLINSSTAPISVAVDGIITKGGETSTAISRMAYEAIYPPDFGERPSAGAPEIRRPLP